jgi:hypothetical protein
LKNPVGSHISTALELIFARDKASIAQCGRHFCSEVFIRENEGGDDESLGRLDALVNVDRYS